MRLEAAAATDLKMLGASVSGSVTVVVIVVSWADVSKMEDAAGDAAACWLSDSSGACCCC